MQSRGIKEIYDGYFNIVDDFFGSIRSHLGPEEDSHINLGLEIASYPLVSDLFLDAIDDIGEIIEDYWRKNLADIIGYIERQDCLKCVYSGDITPPILEKIVKRSALYIDTVILPDPIYNLVYFQKNIARDEKYFLNKLIRHVFNIWKLRELILADTKERFLLILPINLDFINPKDRDSLLRSAETKFVSYLGHLFEQEFVDRESCFDYLGLKNSSKDILNNIKRPELLPNMFKKLKPLDGFLNEMHATRKYAKIPGGSIGDTFGIYVSAQFLRVQEHKFICQRLGAEPIYDNQLAWFFFNYEMGGLDMDAAIASALQQETFEWLTGVPLQAIRVFREEGKLEYMRSVIRRGITDIKAKQSKDLLEVSKTIQENMQEELRRHAREMDALKKEVRDIVRKEIPIASAGYLAGLIPWYGFVVSLPFILRDILRLLGKKRKAAQIIKENEGAFVNLLLKSYEEKN